MIGTLVSGRLRLVAPCKWLISIDFTVYRSIGYSVAGYMDVEMIFMNMMEAITSTSASEPV